MKRLEYLDIARGLCMFFVIAGHLLPNGMIKTFFCSFHLTTFFIISGLIFKRNNEQKIAIRIYIKKNILRIMIPYLLFCLIYIVVDYAIYNYLDFKFIIKSILLLKGLSVLWFFPCVFLAKLLFYLIKKYCDECFHNIIIFIIVITSILYGSVNHDLLLVFSRVGIAISFLWIGYELEDILIKLPKMNFLLLVVILPIFFLFSQINGVVDLYSLMFNITPLYYFISIAGGILCIQISKYLNKCKLLRDVGLESTYILALSQIMIKLFNYLSFNELYSDNALFALSFAIIILLVSLTLCKLYRYQVNLIKKKYEKRVKIYERN